MCRSVCLSVCVRTITFELDDLLIYLRNFDKRPHRISCRYWGLNDPFCCVHHIRDSQCFSIGRTIPPLPKKHLLMRLSQPTSNSWFLGATQVGPQTASRSVQPFLQGSRTLTNRHTDHATPFVAIDAHLMRCVCAMRAKLWRVWGVGGCLFVIAARSVCRSWNSRLTSPLEDSFFSTASFSCVRYRDICLVMPL